MLRSIPVRIQTYLQRTLRPKRSHRKFKLKNNLQPRIILTKIEKYFNCTLIIVLMKVNKKITHKFKRRKTI